MWVCWHSVILLIVILAIVILAIVILVIIVLAIVILFMPPSEGGSTMSRNSKEKPGWLHAIPAGIQPVWHGVNDRTNLEEFISSPIPWAELDVNCSADGERLILRHDTYREMPIWQNETELLLEDTLAEMVAHTRSVKIDFKVGGLWIDRILSILDSFEIPNERLWFNGNLDLLGRKWIAELAKGYPGAVVQVPLNSAIELGCPSTELTQTLRGLAVLGINRWSIGWHYPDRDGLVRELIRQGYEVNIYGVANLDEFLEALDGHPNAVTADFNFPQWGLRGRGSGHRGLFHAF